MYGYLYHGLATVYSSKTFAFLQVDLFSSGTCSYRKESSGGLVVYSRDFAIYKAEQDFHTRTIFKAQKEKQFR